MSTAELPNELKETHNSLWHACSSMEHAQLALNVNGKWSALQHLQHVHKGIAAISDYLKLDRKTIESTFGTVSHVSRTYDGVLHLYTNRLREGAVSTPRFNPAASEDIALHLELETGRRTLDALITSISEWTDSDLDQYACPHPNLGMLTAREMLFFAVIHAIHHTRAIHSLTRTLTHGTFLLP